MANEKRGILFEIITEAALRRAIKIASIPGVVRWNEKPESMSITPDFTIGKEINQPSYVILVTASGSSSNSHMKFGRNIAEFFEAKVQTNVIPLVLNLYFLSNVKDNIDLITKELYDSSLNIDKKPYFSELSTWVDDNIEYLPKGKEARILLLETSIISKPTLSNSIYSLAHDLADSLAKKNDKLEHLWSLMSDDYKKEKSFRKHKITSVKRGLGKLLVLETQIRQLFFKNFDLSIDMPLEIIPAYAFELGFFSKTLAFARLIDEDIIGVLNLLGVETCEFLLKKIPEIMNVWCGEMRNQSNVFNFYSFIMINIDSIKEPKLLATMLEQCNESPELFAKKMNVPFSGSLNRTWLFVTIMDLIKASTGKLTGYGYAQLATELKKSDGISSGYITIADWVNRIPGVVFSTESLLMVATALSEKIQKIPSSLFSTIGQKIIDVSKKSILEDRLIPYRNFEPLLWLLEAELKKQGKAYETKRAFAGWINEFTSLGEKVATTPFIKVGQTLIHWKSSHASHTNDKTKELCARVRNIKYQYDSSKQVFSRRINISQCILIVDGDWNDRNLKTLMLSGWDKIIYPDEIPEFVSQL